MRVVHISDFHFDGTQSRLDDIDREIARVQAFDPDLVLHTGDLSAAGSEAEFSAVQQALEQFGDVPVVILPGNRDIPELYAARESDQDEEDDTQRKTAIRQELRTLRAVDDQGMAARDSGRRVAFTRMFGAANFIYHGDGVTIVALCTLRKVSSQVLQAAARAFSAAGEGDLLLLATHNPFVPIPNRPLEDGDFVKNAGDLLALALDHGVHAVCSGHFHRSHIAEVSWAERHVWLSMAPTLTLLTAKKDRGFHVLDFADGALELSAERTEQHHVANVDGTTIGEGRESLLRP